VTRLVIDCSVALAWSVASQSLPLTDHAQSEVQAHGAIVPFIFPIEMANAMWKLERRKKITSVQLDLALQGLELINMEIDTATLDVVTTTILPLARRHSLSLYDAAYLELALRSQLPLATRDRKLTAAARAAGAQVFAP
jgi:predicted nucleic acid-binding protein